MNTPLDDIRFLADSENRVTAMAALTMGPRTRAELRDATGASKATISRLLRAVEERGWVGRTGERYHLTELGAYVAAAFGEFHGRMTTASDLQSVLPAIPLERLGLDIEAFTGAKVTISTTSNPMAAVVRLRELELGSLESRGLSPTFPEPCIDARHAAVVDGPQRLEMIVPPTVVESALSSEYRHKFMELVGADKCDVYVYTDTIELLGAINDGTACLAVIQGERLALVETSNPAVVNTMSDAFEEYKSRATLLTTDTFHTYESDVAVR